MTFNPNTPNTAGLEWPVALSALNNVDSLSKGHVERLVSSGAETIEALELYLESIAAGGLFAAEVYETGNVAPEGRQTRTSRPSTSSGSNTQRIAGTPPTGGSPWVDVAGNAVGFGDFSEPLAGETAVETWDDSFYIKNATVQDVGHLAFLGGDGLADYTGKRILRVEFWVRWMLAGGLGGGVPVIENAAGNDLIIGDRRAIPIGQVFRNTMLGRFDTNPLNGKPWTAADAEDYFSDGASMRYGVKIDWTTLQGALRVSALWARVVMATENREAFGYLNINADDGWKRFDLTEPDGSANWAKASATSYDVLLRRVKDTGALSWRYLGAKGQACPHVGHRALTAVLDGSYGTGVSLSELETRAHPLRLVRSDDADSADSQPYARIGYAEVSALGTPWRSEFVAPSSDGYGFVKFVGRPAPGAPNDLADLTVKVKRDSDDVQVGGTATITKADADAEPDLNDGWKLLRLQLPTATLVSGTAYYIEFTSTAGGVEETRRWQVLYLSTEAKGASSFGGTASSIDFAGFDFTDADFAATIAIPPDAPTDFATAVIVP